MTLLPGQLCRLPLDSTVWRVVNIFRNGQGLRVMLFAGTKTSFRIKMTAATEPIPLEKPLG